MKDAKIINGDHTSILSVLRLQFDPNDVVWIVHFLFSFNQFKIRNDLDFADYTCIARNKMGVLQKVVTLSEGPKPGIPHIQINSIGHESADLTIMENRRGKSEHA